MTSNTQVLNGTTVFLINKNMGVMRFSLIGLSSNSVFSYKGTQTMLDTSGNVLAPTDITFTGQVAYNSREATNGSNPWDGIVITVSSGSVGLELGQD